MREIAAIAFIHYPLIFVFHDSFSGIIRFVKRMLRTNKRMRHRGTIRFLCRIFEKVSRIRMEQKMDSLSYLLRIRASVVEEKALYCMW